MALQPEQNRGFGRKRTLTGAVSILGVFSAIAVFLTALLGTDYVEISVLMAGVYTAALVVAVGGSGLIATKFIDSEKPFVAMTVIGAGIIAPMLTGNVNPTPTDLLSSWTIILVFAFGATVITSGLFPRQAGAVAKSIRGA